MELLGNERVTGEETALRQRAGFGVKPAGHCPLLCDFGQLAQLQASRFSFRR